MWHKNCPTRGVCHQCHLPDHVSSQGSLFRMRPSSGRLCILGSPLAPESRIHCPADRSLRESIAGVGVNSFLPLITDHGRVRHGAEHARPGETRPGRDSLAWEDWAARKSFETGTFPSAPRHSAPRHDTLLATGYLWGYSVPHDSGGRDAILRSHDRHMHEEKG